MLKIYEKKSLMRALGLREIDRPGFFQWERHADLFGDAFRLVADVTDQTVQIAYFHRLPQNGNERAVWKISLSLSESGRAKISSSENIEPPVKSVVRAEEIIREALAHALPEVYGAQIKAAAKNVLPKP